jgi:hypothetical protein
MFCAPEMLTAFRPLPLLKLTELSEIEALIAPLLVSVFTPPPMLFSIRDRSIDIDTLPLPVGATRTLLLFCVMVES